MRRPAVIKMIGEPLRRKYGSNVLKVLGAEKFWLEKVGRPGVVKKSDSWIVDKQEMIVAAQHGNAALVAKLARSSVKKLDYWARRSPHLAYTSKEIASWIPGYRAVAQNPQILINAVKDPKVIAAMEKMQESRRQHR
ncbi:MAG: hypothetical protein J4415_00765 [Candidatus Diapherotrites archaeon]|uniref:Uncharacterized protein n=1 Tax=Candidatus Iainarchaeum sp. TaxID=3101447 RepID=A0A8T4KS24_9ARCH|nr:hypothetical protein [Candidatus Diapherotrites archaeon]